MPLEKGKSKKTIGRNIRELVSSEPGEAREKGIETIAKKRGIPFEEAKQIQAVAIAFSHAKKKKKK